MPKHVIFGTGPVGTAIAEQLLADSTTVIMVSRSGGRNLPADAQVITGDVADKGFARNVTTGASVVYFAVNPPYTEWPKLFPPLQQSVIEACAAANSKLISAENLYAYGDVHGDVLTESLPYAATGRKGRVRAEMATGLLKAHADGVVRAAIGRASDFFGPGALLSHMGERVFYPAVEGGKTQFVVAIDQPHSYTYINDFAKALIVLGERDEALGRAWHVPSSPAVTTREFAQIVFDEAGAGEARISVMPRLVLNAIGLFNSTLREFKEITYEFDQPFVVDHSDIEAAFGLRPTPVREAISSTLDWYRANPRN